MPNMILTLNVMLSAAAVLVNGGAKPNVLPSHSKYGVYLSPDKKFAAVVTEGEAEASNLRLIDTALKSNAPLISEWDFTGLIWDPASPHRLIYAESGIYGTGKIVVWNGGAQKTIWRKDVFVGDLSWDRSAHLLRFRTLPIDAPGRKMRRSVSFQ